MKTTTSLLSSLITALLLGTALTVAAIDFSVPAIPDSLTNIQKDIDKASATPQANPGPTAGHSIRSKPETSPTPTQTTKNTGSSEVLPYTFYDRYTAESQKPNSTSTSGAQSSSVETHESSWSDMQGQHKKNKKNKKKQHDDDQDQFDNVLTGDYSHAPSPSQSHSTSHKTANSTYDGSPVLYNKPKPASDAQGRFSVDFDGIKSPAPQTQTSHTSKITKNGRVMTDNDDHPGKHKNKQHGHHHHDDDQNQGND
jgi:hypothetical protein